MSLPFTHKWNIGSGRPQAPEFYEQIVKEYRAGSTYQQLADNYKMPVATLYTHLKRRGDLADSDRGHGPRKHASPKIADREKNYRKKYGVTVAWYDKTLAAQDGGCAICGAKYFSPSQPDRSLTIDHDHKTGKVRGVLCHNCNTAIGLLGDNPGRLAQAIAYLRRHSDEPQESTANLAAGLL